MQHHDSLIRIVIRMESNPFYLAHTLAVAGERQGLDRAARMALLDIDEGEYAALALCRTPAGEFGSEEWITDLRRIVQYTGVDPERLAGFILAGQ